MERLIEKEKAAVKKDFTKGALLNREEEKLVASALVKCVMADTAKHTRERKRKRK